MLVYLLLSALLWVPGAKCQVHGFHTLSTGVVVPVMMYDWRVFPNIANNILNAAMGYGSTTMGRGAGSPGFVTINGIQPPWVNVRTLEKVSATEAAENRKLACGGSYCDSLATMGPNNQRYRADNFPTLGQQGTNGACPPREQYNPFGILPLFYSCDEYPFASSTAGAAMARLNCVPDSEQTMQATLTKLFYKGCVPAAFAGQVPVAATGPNGIVPNTGEYLVGVYNAPQDVFDDVMAETRLSDFCTFLPRPTIWRYPAAGSVLSCW